jgi:Divergent InlB B-repeat domain
VLEGPSGAIETQPHRLASSGEVTEVYKLPVSGLDPGATYTVTGKLTSSGAGSVHYPVGGGPPKFQTLARLDVFRRGSGTVTSAPAGIDCGTVCGVDLPIGGGLQLTAIPSAGYRFGHWEGDACFGTSPACTAWVLNWVRTTAVFDQASLVTVTRGGSGSGSVSSAPAGIACGAGCSATFDPGQTVTLTATPDAGSRFSGWSGACNGAGQTCAFQAAVGTQAVQATFVKLATLTVHRTGRGKVKDEAGKIDCGATCTATLDDGTTTTLHAVPARKFRFVRWGGACAGKAPACTVTVTGSQDVTATFKAKKKPRRKSRP